MERWVGKVALVTGASAGIGAEIAKVLALAGMTVIGCGRNIEKILILSDELSVMDCKGKLFGFCCDLNKESDILEMFQQVKDNHGGIDVLVNNAGISFATSILNGKTSDFEEILSVNVLAPAICMREGVRQMVAKGSNGHIININSLSGHRVPPFSAGHFYCASKYALTAMTEQLSPGPVHSEFRERMFRGDQEAMQAFTVSEALTPEDLASSVIFVLGAPEHMQVHDILIRPTSQLG